jgi:hypothetical protein
VSANFFHNYLRENYRDLSQFPGRKMNRALLTFFSPLNRNSPMLSETNLVFTGINVLLGNLTGLNSTLSYFGTFRFVQLLSFFSYLKQKRSRGASLDVSYTKRFKSSRNFEAHSFQYFQQKSCQTLQHRRGFFG